MKKSFFILLCSALSLGAEVYLLGPGRRSSAYIESALPGIEKTLYSETVSINGCSIPMEVSAIRGDLAVIAGSIRKYTVKGKFSFAGDTLLFERELNANQVERYLLISSGPGKPLTCFKMTVPKKLPRPANWPRELPSLPPGAKPVSVTRLADGGISGEFEGARGAPYQLLAQTDSELRSKGYRAVSNEIANTAGGRGDLYITKNSLIWVAFNESGQGAFFYRRRR